METQNVQIQAILCVLHSLINEHIFSGTQRTLCVDKEKYSKWLELSVRLCVTFQRVIKHVEL